MRVGLDNYSLLKAMPVQVHCFEAGRKQDDIITHRLGQKQSDTTIQYWGNRAATREGNAGQHNNLLLGGNRAGILTRHKHIYHAAAGRNLVMR